MFTKKAYIAVVMRDGGATYSQIGERLGVCASRARQIYHAEKVRRALGLFRDTKDTQPIYSGFEELLAAPVGALGITVNMIRCLNRGGVFTIQDLVNVAASDLALMRNIGPKTLFEVEVRLAGLGLNFKETPLQAKPGLGRKLTDR